MGSKRTKHSASALRRRRASAARISRTAAISTISTATIRRALSARSRTALRCCCRRSKKSGLFLSVLKNGALPKKSFSMGNALGQALLSRMPKDPYTTSYNIQTIPEGSQKKKVQNPKKPLAYYYSITLIALLLFNIFVAPLLEPAARGADGLQHLYAHDRRKEDRQGRCERHGDHIYRQGRQYDLRDRRYVRSDAHAAPVRFRRGICQGY